MTRHLPDPEPMAIYDAAMLYKAEGTPLAVIAGRSMAQVPAVTGRRRGRACWGFG